MDLGGTPFMDKLKAALVNCDEWAVKKQQGEATTHPKDGPTQEFS